MWPRTKRRGRSSQRRLAVILHADVVGSTLLVQSDETLAHERIIGAFERLSSTITAYGGTVREVRGDALVAEFSKASDAVCAALAFQESNADYIETLDDEVIPNVRVGLGMGEVVVADKTITGAGVVLAQRIEQLADLGGVCIHGAAYETVPQRFPIDFRNLGERELKGFDDPIRVYAAVLNGDSVVPPPEPISLTSRIKRAGPVRLTVSGVLGIFILSLLAAWWIGPGFDLAWRGSGTFSAQAKPSIAVLPFENLSGITEQDYFSDGITTDIINDLSRFSNLTVIARNSVFVYKGLPTKVQEIARELDVRYVLEGSVQRAGDRVRVNAQFVDARSGEQLWANRFDERVEDLFELQDEITKQLVRTLSVRVTELERRRVFSGNPAEFGAYDFVLRGRALLAQLTRAENFEARELFRNAIAIDPSYATAHAGLGWTYMNAILYGWVGSPVSALNRSDSYARQAITLNESSVDGHRLLARVHLNRGDHDLALLELERAISINPNDADSHAEQGLIFVYTNRVEAAIRALEAALRTDPNLSPEAFMHLGMAYYLQRKYVEALPWLQRGIARNRDNVFIHIALAATYAQLGREKEAHEAANAVRRLDPYFNTSRFGGLFTDAGSVRHFVEGLQKAGIK